jgi:hypothetical protein
MREADMTRLRQEYQVPVEPVPSDRRLNKELDLGIESIVDFGDLIIGDLDETKCGIGWWSAYSDLGRQDRILISDYLAECARDISTNIIEAYISRLDLLHAIDDFKEWMIRGIRGTEVTIAPPRHAYEDLAYFRVANSLAGALRALASSLDCLGACVVGVAGLPIDIVKTSLSEAKEKLAAEGRRTPKPRLRELHSEMLRCENEAGPAGWLEWLMAMRHMLVHRGRRVSEYSIRQGDGGVVEGFFLRLPQSPELTDVQAWVYALGYVASGFEASAVELLDELAKTTSKYLDEVARLLIALWLERKADPALIVQPSRQWRQGGGLIKPGPTFNGYDIGLASGAVREIGAANETHFRLRAAGITERTASDLRPSRAIWS